MNLRQIKKQKDRLRKERYLCFFMAFVMSLGLYGFKKETKTQEIEEMSIEYEAPLESSTLDEETLLEEQADMNNKENAKTFIHKTIPEAKMKLLEEELLIYYSMNNEEQVKEEQVELSIDEKMEITANKLGVTIEQLDMVLAGCVAESCEDGNNYNEGYNVASTFYNRIHSKSFCYDINNIYGKDAGFSVYYQFIAPNQFSVYSNGNYKMYLGRTDLLGYQGALDMFYSSIPSHDYLAFNYIPPISGYYERLEPNGNFYSYKQPQEDKIEANVTDELVLTLEKD